MAHLNKNNSGLTIVELLIVLMIVVMMSLIILSDWPSINENQLLDLTSQDLALNIREAQFYGLSGAEGDIDKTSDFGIYLENINPPPYPNEIIFFADIDRDGKYDDGSISPLDKDEIVRTFLLNNNININTIGCMSENFSSESVCDSFTMIFKRIRTDAFITAQLASGGQLSPGSANEAQYIAIELADTSSHIKRVIIWSSGIIYVE